MPEARAAIPAGVNVLLRILTCEIHVMAHLALGLASCAGVAVRNVKTARVARIPICKTFDKIGVRGALLLLLSTLGRVSWRAALRGKGICYFPYGNDFIMHTGTPHMRIPSGPCPYAYGDSPYA